MHYNQDPDDMSATDATQRFLFDDSDIRGELVCLTGSYRDAVGGHDYPPAVRNLLGEFLAASVLLSTTIKFEGRLVLQVRGNGALSLVMAECTHNGDVRGIARYEGEPLTDTFRGLLGEGNLAITIEPENGEPYQGIVSLDGASLAECLVRYFEQSEQLGTRFRFAVDGGRAVGLLLQQLPGSDRGGAEQREEDWRRVQMLADTLEGEELLSVDNETLLHRLFHEETLRLFPPRDVQYRCSCSRERTATALLTIGRDEVESILAEQHSVTMTCEFCGTVYRFTEEEVVLMLHEPGDSPAH